MCFFFFFKQKTAYEMRISDWSSDVCSSDLTFIAVASENDPYAATAHVWRLSRQWGARFVNAGPFGHINADSALGDWPYGQYLLASLQPAPPPALANERLWARSGDCDRKSTRLNSSH